ERQVFLDVVKLVRHVRPDQHDGARLDRSILVPDAHRRLARDHVVDLVLGVRPLGIRRTGRQHVEPDRKVVGAHDLVVQAPRRALCGEEVGKLEGVHEPRLAPARTDRPTLAYSPAMPSSLRIRALAIALAIASAACSGSATPSPATTPTRSPVVTPAAS